MNKNLSTTKPLPLSILETRQNATLEKGRSIFRRLVKIATSMVRKLGTMSTMPMSKEVMQRCIFGIIMAVGTIAIIIAGGMVFDALILLISIIVAFEWSNMIQKMPHEKSLKSWYLIGVLYIYIPSFAMIAIRHMEGGMIITLWYMLTIWSSDTTAYFVGKTIQGKKLCPSISPTKTYSGMLGGLCGGVTISLLLYHSISAVKNISWLHFMILAIITTLISQISDLLESAIKRKCGVKDSGSLIPGHGGVMDRTDSLVLTAPFIMIVVYFCR